MKVNQILLLPSARLIFLLTISSAYGSQEYGSGRADIICDPDGYYFIPFGDNCTMYVHCAFGTPILHTCADGTLFDPEEQKCVLEENYTCPPPATTTQTPPIEDTTEHSQYPCPNDPFIYVQHPEKCSLFYLCKNGEFQTIISCGVNWFDSISQSCVRPEESDCTVEPLPVPTTTDANLFPCPNDPFIYVQHPEKCSLFYLCKNGEFQTVISCGVNWFDSVSQSCVKPEASDCTLESLPTTTEPPLPTTTSGNLLPCPNDPFIYIQHPDSCSLFYLCTNGNFRGIFTCGTEHWFDSASQSCVRPEDSDCMLEPRPTTTTEVTEPEQPITTPEPPPISTTELNLFPCPNDPFIYLQHPQSCFQFYLCTNGEFRGIFSCGTEHWFDSASQSCVRPEESDCKIETLPPL